MTMCVVNATLLLKRTLQWETRQSGPVVAVIGGCMLIVSVRLLSTVMADTECVQIVFYSFTFMSEEVGYTHLSTYILY